MVEIKVLDWDEIGMVSWRRKFSYSLNTALGLRKETLEKLKDDLERWIWWMDLSGAQLRKVDESARVYFYESWVIILWNENTVSSS